MAGSSSLVELATLAGTLIANGIAAYNAFLARRSADAALANVEEARAARRYELLPQIFVESNFSWVEWYWPDPASRDGCPTLRAFASVSDDNFTIPTLTFVNHGHGPAMDVMVTFNLIDRQEEYDVPEQFSRLGISLGEPLLHPTDRPIPTLRFDNSEHSRSLYRRMHISIPHLIPGKLHHVEIPEAIMDRVFLRALQCWTTKYRDTHIKLEVLVEAFTMESESISSTFRFDLNPAAPLQMPVKAHSTFLPCPIIADRPLVREGTG